MLELTGYHITELLYESPTTLIYRGMREKDSLPIIAKLLNAEYPSRDQVQGLEYEYRVTKELALPGVLKAYALEHVGHSKALIMEDFGGMSLTEHLSSELKLDALLAIAQRVTDIVASIHQQHLIHRDLKPANILINPDTHDIRVIDFSLAEQVTKTRALSVTSPHLVGTLAYMSPEQTGRMNQSVDYRSDLYSLGVTFYQMLTGQLPFDADEPLELVHGILAKQAIPPHVVKPHLPLVLSQIVMKLLAKNPSQRYQTAHGLAADLAECLRQYRSNGTILDLELGEHDMSQQLKLPAKLYGREEAVARLRESFERSKQGAEMMLVAGYSGVGKSSLVYQLQTLPPFTRSGGYFITGKFDQLSQNIPYSALKEAFGDLIQQRLTESEAQLSRWRQQLRSALGVNGQVMLELIPELGRIIGPQPESPTLSASESQNRFQLVFLNFIRTLVDAPAGHDNGPLVIFLDDLQWADSATLKLLQTLLIAEVPHLFLIGAYRDNQVTAGHPLMLQVAEMQKEGARLNTLTLRPLTLADVTHLTSDTLQVDLQRAAPLASLIFNKTGGNPFFVNQFLQTLYEEGLLSWQEGWQWELARIDSMQMTDNVIDLMSRKIQKLPQKTQAVLKLAACIGHQFDLQTLSVIHQASLSDTIVDLWPALVEGLIITRGWHAQDRAIGAGDIEAQAYLFLHDRVQQAAYSLIAEANKGALHLQIGRLILASGAQPEGETLFRLVNHLNLGREFISDEQEKRKLAQLNLYAGQKALASTAYEPAFSTLQIGLGLLTAEDWHASREYELTLALHVAAAEAAYLSGDFRQMEQLVRVVKQKANTLLDQVKVTEVEIQAHIAQHQLVEAVNTGLAMLALLGIKWPAKPTQLDVVRAFMSTKWALVGKSPQSLADLPPITDRNTLAIVRIFGQIGSPVYLAAPELMPLLSFTSLNLLVKYGNAFSAPGTYTAYGLILCGVMGDIERGYQFGQLGIKLLDQLNVKEQSARPMLLFNGFVRHWKEHLRETLPGLQEGYQRALETGDLEYAASSISLFTMHALLLGQELKSLEEQMASYNQVIRRLKQETILNYQSLHWQVAQNLLGRVDKPWMITGEVYDENKMRLTYKEANDKTGLYYLTVDKMILCYLFGQYSEAHQASLQAEEYLESGIGTPHLALFYFYDSLIRLTLLPQVSSIAKMRHRLRVRQNQNKLKKWAKHAPMNHQHKYLLVYAERLRLAGKAGEARIQYDEAIRLAKLHGYLQEEALAYELAGKFYLAAGSQQLAQFYLTNAYQNYKQWGAVAKVKALEAVYPRLLAIQVPERENRRVSTLSLSASDEMLDLASIMKATQALSSELELDKLLAKLIKIAIENAGAQRGFLLLKNKSNGVLQIEAAASIDSDEVQLGVVPLEDNQAVSETIVRYVERSGQHLVLHDATEAGIFKDDAYILKAQPKSILCTPLSHQEERLGVLYLENNLTPNAFTDARVQVLQALLAQAAISLLNAYLYDNLTQEIKERKRAEEALASANQELLAARDDLEERVQERTIQLAQTNQDLETMLYVVSHDLKEPLRAIQNFSRLVSRRYARKLDEKGQDYLTRIEKAAIRLRTLIDDILTLSRAQRMEIPETKISSQSLIQTVLERLEGRIEQTNATIDVAADLPELRVNRTWATQALYNLVSNAIKYGGTEDKPPQIEIVPYQGPEGIGLIVNDRGPGIEPEQAERIFQLFQRAVGREIEGTGAGLAIVRQIALRHGGNAWVRAREGGGAEFVITFGE